MGQKDEIGIRNATSLSSSMEMPRFKGNVHGGSFMSTMVIMEASEGKVSELTEDYFSRTEAKTPSQEALFALIRQGIPSARRLRNRKALLNLMQDKVPSLDCYTNGIKLPAREETW
ncbi:hypothetical protein ACET3Z_025432 [Daucus carota]